MSILSLASRRGNRLSGFMSMLMRLIDWPPIWLAICGAAMWVLSLYVPGFSWDISGLVYLGYAAIAFGFVLTLWSAIHFRRARTSIIPRQNPDALVTGGPYRWSRNPIYLADAVILGGWGLILQCLVPFIMLPVFIALIERRFIIPEEAVLSAAFPESFDAYRAQTRRWI